MNMRAVVQRVKNCSVRVDEKISGSIERGILVYLGVERGDGEEDLAYIVDKTINLRIFQDEAGKMNLSVIDTEGSVLAISQFTLCADTRKGRRPSYNHAASPQEGESLYRAYIEEVKKRGVAVEEGIFGAHMQVAYLNDGPVTLILDSKKRI
jgi:D-aminoacyl-tRNA deacylase